ncbi:MAG: aldo/keto reductase [Chloroflexi bacterium]|nr:aldo/keto reductase [Chloroflexota bacterium]
MKYRVLAGTDLNVSEIGFGVWSVSTSWWGEIPEEDGISLMRHGLDLGINFFDTGDAYGAGYGEEILGKAFQGNRDDIIIGSKFGYDLEAPREPGQHRERPQKWDPEFVKKACESSLRRLGTDRIDFYQLHNPRLTALESDDTFAALEELRDEGKVRYVGAAIGPDIGWTEEGIYAVKNRRIPSQIIYNILEQDPAVAFIEEAQSEGVGLLSRVPHASGLLDGKYTRATKFDANDHRSFRKQQWLDKSMTKVDQLDFLFNEKNATMAQVSVKFVLTPEIIASVLVTATEKSQLEEFCGAVDMPELPVDELDRLSGLYADNFGVGEKDQIKSSIAEGGFVAV